MFADVMTEQEVGRWAALIIAVLFTFTILRKKRFGFRGSEHGTARWGTDSELKKRGMLGED